MRFSHEVADLKTETLFKKSSWHIFPENFTKLFLTRNNSRKQFLIL